MVDWRSAEPLIAAEGRFRMFWRRSSIALLFVTCTAVLQGQTGSELSNRVRSLNSSLLRLHGRAQEALPRDLNELRNQAHVTIQERAAALESLIQQDPEEALKLGFSSDMLDELSRLFPRSAGSLESYGDWDGPANYWVLDDAGLRSSKNIIKISVGNETLDVHYPGDAPGGLKCGSILHVSGMRVSRHVAPTASTVQPAAATAKVTAQSAGACSSTGVQNVAVVLVTFPGVTPPITPSAVYNVFFGSGNRSLNGYWQDASHGLTSASGNVFGWYTLPQAYTCDQYSALGTAAMQAAAADVNFASYNSIFFVFPLPSGCSYGGLSTIGCITQTANGQTVTASNHWLIADYLSPNDQGVELAAHEGGHGLTLNHAHSRGFSPLALGALGVNGTVTEYGDNFDPMGYYNLGHYGAQHKVQLGWLSPSNVVNVQGSGTYTIAPMGASTAGPVALQVQRGTGNNDYLWVEYHQPVGNYESQLSSQIFGGATIRYLDSLTGGGYTDLLNFTPQANSWLDPVLATGQSWQDPYSNLSLTVTSATSTSLTLGVNFGTMPCTRGTPTMTVSPSNPSVVSGGTVGYTVNVTNTDSSGCSTGAFSVSSALPSGWATSMSSSSINLAPGQTGSVSVSKSVPSGTTPGTYSIPVGASDGSTSNAMNVNCSVTAPPPPLSGTISVSATTYPGKANVPITVNVLSGTLPAAGASVAFTLNGPKGGPSTQTLTTNTSGVATWTYRASNAGSYSVSAKVTLGSQTIVTNVVTFSVQ
jgi:M6 family metalloprotease-like protein